MCIPDGRHNSESVLSEDSEPPVSAFPAKASDITEQRKQSPTVAFILIPDPHALCTQLVQVLSHHLFRVNSDAATVTGTHGDDYSSSSTVKNGGQLLRLSMLSQRSLDKCHNAFEVCGLFFKSVLILLSNNSCDIAADSV